MRILCLCPTFGRPKLVANALACFLAQDYPAEKRHLLIFDDAGQFNLRIESDYSVLSRPERFSSLPSKYNEMLRQSGLWGLHWYDWDAVAVWDDDDIYASFHLSAAAAALANGAPSCKPSKIYTLYRPTGALDDGPWLEPGSGRFHCSCVFSVDRLREIGGWIQTKRADFDQQQIKACGPAADTLPYCPGNVPSFCYRWGSTGAQHCSSLMRSPDNEDWYDRYQPADLTPVGQLVPKMDDETARVYATIGAVADK